MKYIYTKYFLVFLITPYFVMVQNIQKSLAQPKNTTNIIGPNNQLLKKNDIGKKAFIVLKDGKSFSAIIESYGKNTVTIKNSGSSKTIQLTEIKKIEMTPFKNTVGGEKRQQIRSNGDMNLDEDIRIDPNIIKRIFDGNDIDDIRIRTRDGNDIRIRRRDGNWMIREDNQIIRKKRGTTTR